MQVKPGHIFEDSGNFYQVIKATEKTAVVRPIEGKFVGYADQYGREHAYMPVADAFTTDPWMSRDEATRGKRLKIHDYSQAGNSPELHFGCRTLYFWDGKPSVLDTYS